MTENDILAFITEHYQMCFLYGLKILNDISKGQRNLEKIVTIHDIEIANLKEKN